MAENRSRFKRKSHPEGKRSVRLNESELDEGFVGFHEASLIFPEMTDVEYDEFKKDIETNGLLSPIITTPDGQILDGRHRWRACMQLGIKPKYQVHKGNPWAYVISANLHRRHLSASQRAMVAARIANRPSGGDRRSPEFQNPKSGFETHLPPTQAETAKALNIAVSTITQGRSVLKRGIPELVKLVDDGLVSTNAGKRIAKLNETVQREFVTRIRNGERPRDISPIMLNHRYDRIAKSKVIKHPSIERFTKNNADALDSTLRGVTMAFQSIVVIDDSVTPQMAKSLMSQIRTARAVLAKLNKLLGFIEASSD